jgi:hypothetical protein
MRSRLVRRLGGLTRQLRRDRRVVSSDCTDCCAAGEWMQACPCPAHLFATNVPGGCFAREAPCVYVRTSARLSDDNTQTIGQRAAEIREAFRQTNLGNDQGFVFQHPNHGCLVLTGQIYAGTNPLSPWNNPLLQYTQSTITVQRSCTTGCSDTGDAIYILGTDCLSRAVPLQPRFMCRCFVMRRVLAGPFCFDPGGATYTLQQVNAMGGVIVSPSVGSGDCAGFTQTDLINSTNLHKRASYNGPEIGYQGLSTDLPNSAMPAQYLTLEDASCCDWPNNGAECDNFWLGDGATAPNGLVMTAGSIRCCGDVTATNPDRSDLVTATSTDRGDYTPPGGVAEFYEIVRTNTSVSITQTSNGVPATCTFAITTATPCVVNPLGTIRNNNDNTCVLNMFGLRFTLVASSSNTTGSVANNTFNGLIDMQDFNQPGNPWVNVGTYSFVSRIERTRRYSTGCADGSCSPRPDTAGGMLP